MAFYNAKRVYSSGSHKHLLTYMFLATDPQNKAKTDRIEEINQKGKKKKIL